MNVFWINEGKKFTILGSISIGLLLIGIIATDNTLVAAGFGAMLLIFGIITLKSAEGWAIARDWDKKDKESKYQYQ